MHNIKSNFDYYYQFTKLSLKSHLNSDANVRFYPHRPKMNDLEIITLSIVMETLSIDSENYFFSKLREEYHQDFPNLIDRTRFNRRRKQLCSFIDLAWTNLSNQINKEAEIFVVDSMPLSVIKLAREAFRKSSNQDENNLPAKGYSAIQKQYFVGYKLDLIVSESGVPHNMMITPANVHDINYLKEAELQMMDCTLLGDRAYLSKDLQLSLFEEHQIKLKTANRTNQKLFKKFPKKLKGKRMIIETIHNQLIDQFMIHYAK